MSLEKFDTKVVNGVRQSRAYVSGASQPRVVRLSYTQLERITTCEPVSPYTPSGKSHGQLREMRTRSRLSRDSIKKRSIKHSNLIYIEISEVGLRLFVGF